MIWIIAFITVGLLTFVGLLIRSYNEGGFMGKNYNESQYELTEENYPPMKQFNKE